ncbi:MAG: hypothetical protein ACYSUV_19905 [Planctomycetota bacterium]
MAALTCDAPSAILAMRTQDVLGMLLFAAFFSVGAAALSSAILCDDLVQYYTNRGLLYSAQETLRQLESLNADYDALLEQLEKDPNFVRRIAPAAVGAEPSEEDTVYPKVTAAELDAARKALTEASADQASVPAIPRWLSRCRGRRQRIALFLSGAFLVLVSFVWFGPGKPGSTKT